MTGLAFGYSIALVVLILLSFFFSSSDMAYGSVDVLKLNADYEKGGKKKLKNAKKLTDDYSRTLSTILLLNDTVNAGLDSVSTLLGVTLATTLLTNVDSQTAETWGLVASIICLIVKIVFGEIIAKSFGKIFNYRLSILYSKVILVLSYVTLPITYLVSGFGKIVSTPLIRNIKDVEISEDDLHEMVEGIEKQGMVDEEKATLLHETIRYTHTEAYEVMTPRVDMFAIDIEDDIQDILDDPKTYKFSRVPVYEGTIDNIVGYVRTRRLMVQRIQEADFSLRDLLETPLRFPRSTEINDILKAFKKQKSHFALVMDEYGGVEGLITMEDILEEIVGEIWDEKDDPEEPYRKRKDGSYIIDGSLTLEDFCDLFRIDYDKTDTEYVTIGGYVVELLDDHFANVGDTCQFENLDIKVIAVDKNGAVEKLLVKPRPETEEKDA